MGRSDERQAAYPGLHVQVQEGKCEQDRSFLTTLLAWLMSTPNRVGSGPGPFIPFDLVFDTDAWMKWTRSNNFRTFVDREVQWRGEISNGLWTSVDEYETQIRSWIGANNMTRNITFARHIGDLTELDVSFGVEAFQLKKDLKTVD